MPVAPTVIDRAIDPDVLLDGVRATLLANSTVAAAVGERIYPDIAPEGTPAPYITLSRPSVVYGSPYGTPSLNALIDVSVYDKPLPPQFSTTVVRALSTACLTALIDHPWTVPGLVTNAVTMEGGGAGFRTLDENVQGAIIRGRQFTVRVITTKLA